ncbi:TPA: DUF4352 domain-containing protein [Clostridium perfringens]|uniref:DUF4352 domain-containing protein n=1 Tax=Clostridium perfringens TaxID=1502 RepID=UPI0010CFEB49|nr:DUF4352 domain-containing protein [Clostridium perfringens]EJT5912973.1 DUF4352 domain-containing protein [Clostridium perfringens]EJT6150465.1 DUF4352 domain-containing protein [Clostridium perfringens]EJT6156089.1 DUF4352 domain-containing protein [Clostridium perfringens]UBK67024.1 DUF4352 domain-containing protein [Clostridium perfringens]VTQ60226.1 Telomeric repeat-binding factor 2 [Clostridium perfringens]
MKKGLVVLLSAIVISGALVGCGSDTPKKVEDQNQKQEQQQESKVETFKVGDTIQTKDFKITVNKVETSEGGEFVKPKDGNEFIKADITIENTSKEEQNVSSMIMFKVVDKDGRSYNQAIVEDQNGQLDGKVAPGRKMTGEYVVEVPKGATGLQLEFDSSLLNSGQVIVDLN